MVRKQSRRFRPLFRLTLYKAKYKTLPKAIVSSKIQETGNSIGYATKPTQATLKSETNLVELALKEYSQLCGILRKDKKEIEDKKKVKEEIK